MALKDKLTKCELGVISAGGILQSTRSSSSETTEPERFVSTHRHYYLHIDIEPLYFSWKQFLYLYVILLLTVYSRCSIFSSSKNTYHIWYKYM